MTVDWIRSGLKRTGKTRSGLAKALGRSPSAVTDLLNGHRRLRADEIATVSDYLGVEPPRLIGGGPPRPPSAPLVGYVGAGALWARCKSLRCRAEERMASARSVSTFGGRRRRGEEEVMDLALSVLPCYVLALFSIGENRRLCQGSVFLNCGFSETRLIA